MLKNSSYKLNVWSSFTRRIFKLDYYLFSYSNWLNKILFILLRLLLLVLELLLLLFIKLFFLFENY